MMTLSERDFPLAVYLFDLDDLKIRNDNWGHAKGDQMLTRFGTFLRAHTRENDILARFGGDEFIVIIRQMPSGEVAEKKGNEICKAVRSQSMEGISLYPALPVWQWWNREAYSTKRSGRLTRHSTLRKIKEKVTAAYGRKRLKKKKHKLKHIVYSYFEKIRNSYRLFFVLVL